MGNSAGLVSTLKGTLVHVVSVVSVYIHFSVTEGIRAGPIPPPNTLYPIVLVRFGETSA